MKFAFSTYWAFAFTLAISNVTVFGQQGTNIAPPSGSSGPITCNNTKVCVPKCGECVTSCSAAEITVPKDSPCPEGYVEKTASLIDNWSFSHVHSVWDWRVGKAGIGCASCGSSAASDQVMGLGLQRFHRLRDITEQGSFGPGVFQSYDINLSVMKNGSANRVRIFHPSLSAPIYLDDGLNFQNNGDVKDGIYVDSYRNMVKELRLTNSNGDLVTDIYLAKKAVLTAYDGKQFSFDIFPLNSPTQQSVPGTTVWKHADIGAVSSSGSASFGTSQDFDIKGSGADIWNNADSFRYVYQTISGDFDISSRVASVENANSWSKAGLMARQSTAVGSVHASVMVTPGNGYAFQSRTIVNGASSHTSGGGAMFPNSWLRLTRTGNTMHAYRSYASNQVGPTAWQEIGFVQLTASDPVLVGMCVTSHLDGTLCKAEFRNVALSGTGVGTAWQSTDIGTSTVGETTDLGSQNAFTLRASGNDLWNQFDEGHFAYQALRGNGSLTVRLAAQVRTNEWAKAGVAFRESLASNANFAFMMLSPDNGLAFQRRTATQANAIHTAGPTGAVPQWLRIERAGNVFTGSYSVDGTTWIQAGSETIAMGQDVYVGMLGTAHHDMMLSTSVFDNVALAGTPTPSAEWPATGLTDFVAGRLTKISDRNGYSISLTYKFNASNPSDAVAIAESPERQWQINTITDPETRQLQFSYDTTQVSGRWVVNQIALPNGQTVGYQYLNGKLSGVLHADGTVSAFSVGFDAATGLTVVSYDDAADEGTHRRKEAYLTSNFQLLVADHLNDIPFVWNSASMLLRMIKKDGEVVYLNVFDSNDASKVKIYSEGTLREMSDWGRRVRYFKEGWTYTPNNGYATFQGTPEDTFASQPQGDYYKNYVRNAPASMTNNRGVTRQYEYTAADRFSKVTYPDTTTEEFSYGVFELVTRQKDRLNRVTKYSYDARGNMLTKEVGILFDGANDVNQPEYAIYRWEYYPAGNVNQFLLKTEFDANYKVGQSDMHRTDYVYDANHCMVKKIEGADVAGGVRAEINFTYDGIKRLATSADALGRTTTYTYDTRDRVVKITYSDSSSERFIYGTGTDANLLVKQKDRNGNITKFEYDNFGRRVKTVSAYSVMALDDSETLITDPSVKVEEICTFVQGTTLKASCVSSGERTEYTYDYRNRNKTTKVYPHQGMTLTSTNAYVNNLLFSHEDPYGRKSYNSYRSSDSALVRTVRGSIPTYSLADFAAVTAATRDLSNNAAYVVEDIELDAERQMVARVDGRNIRHTMKYDSRGHLVETIEAESVGGVPSVDAAKTVYEFDANSNRTRIKNPRTFSEASNFFTEFTYTGRNLLASQTEAADKPEAAIMSYVYALDRRLLETTDGRNNIWKQTWKDCCGRIATKVDPLLADGTRPYSYFQQDFYGNTTHVVRLKDFATFADCCMSDPLDGDTINETTTKFDARHRPVARTTWLVARGAVDPNGVPIAGENGVPATDGLTTRWRYDENLADAQGIDTDYAAQINARLGAGYFGSLANGYAVETTNPAGEKSVAIYDGAGRTVLQIDGNKNSVKSTYDVVVGNLLETAIADGLDHISKGRADGIGRVRESVDAESKVTTIEYDANSNRVKFFDSNGVGMDCVFDVRNRDIQCTDTALPPSVTKKTFDAHNNVTVLTDALNKNIVCIFDARDRKISCTSRISGTMACEYDKNNNLEKITDAGGGITTYTYDSRNLLSTETFPAHNKPNGHYDIREYAYDAASRLKTRKVQFLEVTTYNYDLANRLLSRAYPDSLNDTFTYDAASRLLSAANARYNNIVTRDYTLGGESGGRLKRETQTIGAVPYQINYAYDVANRQASVTYPTGDVVARTFTDRNQLSVVNFNGNVVASFVYDNGMRRTQTTFGNGVVEDRTYFTDNLNSTIKANKGASKITDFAYSWDVNKRKTAEVDGIVPPVNSQTFGYDDEDRLTSFARNNGDTQSWNLSLVGDWNSFTKNGNTETRAHNDAHEIRQVGATTVNHDVKGNLTLNSNAQAYSWDIENRLKQAVVPTGSTTGVVGTHTYAYDALGRRVSKTVGATTTVFVNDGLQEICEYENSTLARSYVFGSYIDEPLRMTNTSGIYYYHANQIYSLSALTDSTGICVERYTFDSYGKLTVLNGAGVPTGDVSTKGNPWTFTGRRFDGETGLMYYRARMYSTELGRFLGRDPIGHVDGMNLYEYVKSSPDKFIDPSGLWSIVRDRQSRAEAIPAKGDTIDSLGQLLRLDTSEYNKWLQMSGENCPESATDEIDPAEDPDCNCKFSVPNTVYIDLGDSVMWTFWTFYADQIPTIFNQMYYESFFKWMKYDSQKYKVTRSVTSDEEIEAHLMDKDLYHYLFYGHSAYDSGFSFINGGVISKKYTQYGIAYMGLFMCLSAKPDGLLNASGYSSGAIGSGTQVRWRMNVSSRGVFEGYSQKANGIDINFRTKMPGGLREK